MDRVQDGYTKIERMKHSPSIYLYLMSTVVLAVQGVLTSTPCHAIIPFSILSQPMTATTNKHMVLTEVKELGIYIMQV